MALRAIVASFAVHASVAAGLVAAGRGGHAMPGSPVVMTAEVLEIDTATDTIEAPLPEPAKEPAKNAQANVVAPPPDHTHPYPVPGHDARPHDPSQPHAHDRDHDHDDHDHDQVEGTAAAAAVVANDSAAKMPVFSIASGSGSMTAGSTRVADRKGDGAGTGASANDANASANVTYPASGVSVPAKLVGSATAAYPTDARADDVEGDVGLEIVVDAQGQVIDARVAKRAGHGFDESALAAIRRYRFSAAQRDGRNVRVRMPWTVQFRLR